MTAVLDWTRATVLSLTEFEVCWELLGLGETPIQLDPPGSGHTPHERRRIVSSVGMELRRRGLGDGYGPHLLLAEQLRLIATADLTLDVRLIADTHASGSLVAGVAACRGDRCVLAVRHRGEIAMLDLPAGVAPAALVELIGAVVPGPGAAVSLPGPVLDTVCSVSQGDPARFAEELVWRGIARPEAARLVGMCANPRQLGQFGATATSATGWRRRAPYVVGTLRTGEGHYRHLRRRAAGVDTVTIAPVTGDELLADLAELAQAAVRVDH